jgi:predicted acyl esterase
MPYRSFANWPIPETQYTTLFLTHDKVLSPIQPNQLATFTYQADAPAQQMDNDPGELRFEHTFSAATHMIGYSRVVLHMSSDQADDFDVFVQLRKADRNGRLLQNINIPPADLGLREEEVEAINPLKYLGPSGILRASHRDIDRERSKPHWPFYPHTTKKLIQAGEVVRLEIGIWPTAIRFEAREKLVLKVAGHNMSLAEFPLLRGKSGNCNKGAHNVFVGPGNLSSLTIPIVELE